MYDFNEDNIRESISYARTDKLYCSDCKKKIKKGNKVIFIVDYSERRPRMLECYCSKCGYEIEESILEAEAFADAVGIGQD